MPGANVFISYWGTASGCTQNGGFCRTGEILSFSAASFGYDFSCSAHTYSWNLGDGAVGLSSPFRHAYAVSNRRARLSGRRSLGGRTGSRWSGVDHPNIAG